MLAAEGRDVRELAGCRTWEAILARCRSEYLTRGLESLRHIAGASVDFVWSQAVQTWDRLPTARRKLNDRFGSLPDEDLLTQGFAVVLRPIT